MCPWKIILLGRMGCLLPLLIIFNLFFGWMFFGFLLWALIEIVLIIIFILVSLLTARRIFRQEQQKDKDNVIDIEAEVLDDKKRLN